MSKLNLCMLVVGLSIAMTDVLRRIHSSDPQKASSAIQFIPMIAFAAPFLIMVLALLSDEMFELDRISADRNIFDALLFLGILASIAASGIGVFTLMVLSVNGNIGRVGWQQPAIRRVFIFACLDVVHPVLLVASGVIITLVWEMIFG